MLVLLNPMPYQPATLDTRQATILTHSAETIDGVVVGEEQIPSEDWAWAICSEDSPFPGTPDPTQICLKNGFDPTLSYSVVFKAKDPYVLGIGFAAFRDVGSFFRNEVADDFRDGQSFGGTGVLGDRLGTIQAGNFLKAFLHQGFNQDEAGRQVQDGTWPMIAGGQIPLNMRFGLPDGASGIYSADREAPQWWAHYPDAVRKRADNGILDRCAATDTCPKIVELFGSTEMWFLKMSAALVGTAADADVPLPANVRRYYIASSPHGGGPGGFDVTPLEAPTAPELG